MRRSVTFAVFAVLVALSSSPVFSWGERGHYAINRAAVRAIGDDGLVFLRAQEDWIVYLAIIPDSWRRPSDPFVKMIEDPNHGWFREQFAFMREVPRSRYEFVLALYDEHKRLVAAGNTKAAELTNVRWTGTMPYAAVETYEQMVTGMRRYRDAKGKGADTKLVELEIASYMGRLGHYTGDGAQPLHDTIHHDGWQGENPSGYATEPQVHGRFESQFVDRIALSSDDFQKDIQAARVLEDPFAAILEHLDDAAAQVEAVYRLDQAGKFMTDADPEARALTLRQMVRASTLLRDLAHTAWIRSSEPFTMRPGDNPIAPTHPRYNPATGSAPAPRPPQPQ